MTKKDYLDQLMLLSALESWCFSMSDQKHLPDWLVESLGDAVEKLKAEILEDKCMTEPAIWKPSACCSFRWVERPKIRSRGNGPGYGTIIETVLQQIGRAHV